MSARRQPSIRNPRPLPPLPLHFCTTSVGRNIRCVREGITVQWTPQLHLGRCGLAASVRKGDTVCVEVTGTGYFTVDVRNRQLSDQQLQSTDMPPVSQSLSEVKFKLKKSKFTIKFVRTSRSSLQILSTNTVDGESNKYDVKVPSGTEPWPTFNVQFGLLSLTSVPTGKHKKAWPFQSCHGLNITSRSRVELASLLFNPCALVTTERAVGPRESVMLLVRPECKGTLSSVKIHLTNTPPSALHLHAKQVYFDTHHGVYRALYQAYEVKRFHGLLRLRVYGKAGELEIKQDDARNKDGLSCTQCIRLASSRLDLNRPIFICLELFRVRVDVMQTGTCPSSYASSYAVPAGTEQTERHGLNLPDILKQGTSDYLTPVPYTSFPDLPGQPSLNSPRVRTAAVHHDQRQSEARYKPAGRRQQLAPREDFVVDDGTYEMPVVNFSPAGERSAVAAEPKSVACAPTTKYRDTELTEGKSKHISTHLDNDATAMVVEIPCGPGHTSWNAAAEATSSLCRSRSVEAPASSMQSDIKDTDTDRGRELSPDRRLGQSSEDCNQTLQRECLQVPGRCDDVYVGAKLQRLDNAVQALGTLVADISHKLQTLVTRRADSESPGAVVTRRADSESPGAVVTASHIPTQDHDVFPNFVSSVDWLSLQTPEAVHGVSGASGPGAGGADLLFERGLITWDMTDRIQQQELRQKQARDFAVRTTAETARRASVQGGSGQIQPAPSPVHSGKGAHAGYCCCSGIAADSASHTPRH